MNDSDQEIRRNAIKVLERLDKKVARVPLALEKVIRKPPAEDDELDTVFGVPKSK